MSLRSNHRKLIGAAGAAALTVGGLAAPALAAGELTADVDYTCQTDFGPATPSASYAVNQPPAKIVAGDTVKLGTTATFGLDATTTGLAQTVLGWDSFKGRIRTKPTNGHVGQRLAIEKTNLGNGPGGSTEADAAGKTLLRYTKTGTFTLRLADIGTVSLTGFDDTDANVGTIEFPNDDGSIGRCKNDAGKTPLRNAADENATVKVVKDRTTTDVTADYNAIKNAALGKAKVKSRFGLKPTGTVKFILKKGTNTIATAKDDLNKRAVAKVLFKGVQKTGKYKIVGKYLGNAALKSSKGADTFTVG
jgi:hypothetical protein